MLPTRFWSKVNKTDTCWLWTAGTHNGYPRYRHDGRNVLAYKLAYESIHGPVDDGLELDHTCRVRHCVNPDHLEPVSHATNIQRGNWKGRPKSHCLNGHEFIEPNYRWRKDMRGRVCLLCPRWSKSGRS